MPRRRKEEDEVYEFSIKSEDAIQLYWPASVNPKHPFFERYMIELQLALIEGHLPVMFASDKKRAKNTVKQLRHKLGMLGREENAALIRQIEGFIKV